MKRVKKAVRHSVKCATQVNVRQPLLVIFERGRAFIPKEAPALVKARVAQAHGMTGRLPTGKTNTQSPRVGKPARLLMATSA